MLSSVAIFVTPFLRGCLACHRPSVNLIAEHIGGGAKGKTLFKPNIVHNPPTLGGTRFQRLGNPVCTPLCCALTPETEGRAPRQLQKGPRITMTRPSGDSIAILERLVRFDTTSRFSNMALIDHVRDYLEGLGARILLNPNEDGSKANLVASFGPDVPGGIILSGHSDVVPVDDQPWTTDAFTLRRDKDRLIGRGTADMKGFIASALAAAPAFAGAPLERPVHLCLTYDEEVGCLGIQHLIPVLREKMAPPRLMVIGEPTSMQVATSHKGQHVYRTTVTGKAAHSSRPMDGVNAVMAAARLISFIEEMANKAEEGPFDEAFDPAYTSFNVGPIAGGAAFNIVADHVSFDWDQRPIPSEDGMKASAAFDIVCARLDAELKAKDPRCGIRHERWAHLLPLEARPGSDGETLAQHLAERNDTTVAAFGTEAGFIQKGLDWPVVVCGPGDIAQAHQADEYITTKQMAACDRFMARVVEALTLWRAG